MGHHNSRRMLLLVLLFVKTYTQHCLHGDDNPSLASPPFELYLTRGGMAESALIISLSMAPENVTGKLFPPKQQSITTREKMPVLYTVLGLTVQQSNNSCCRPNDKIENSEKPFKYGYLPYELQFIYIFYILKIWNQEILKTRHEETTCNWCSYTFGDLNRLCRQYNQQKNASTLEIGRQR